MNPSVLCRVRRQLFWHSLDLQVLWVALSLFGWETLYISTFFFRNSINQFCHLFDKRKRVLLQNLCRAYLRFYMGCIPFDWKYCSTIAFDHGCTEVVLYKYKASVRNLNLRSFDSSSFAYEDYCTVLLHSILGYINKSHACTVLRVSLC